MCLPSKNVLETILAVLQVTFYITGQLHYSKDTNVQSALRARGS